MKKFLMVGVLALAGITEAKTLADIFSTSKNSVSSACDDGYRVEEMPRTTDSEKTAFQDEYDKVMTGKFIRDFRTYIDKKADPKAYLLALTQPIDLRTPLGMAANVCGLTARDLSEKPKSGILSKAVATFVYISGTAKSLAETKTWNAVLVSLDKSGHELSRAKADASSRKGDLDSWEPYCTESGCNWMGTNIYVFNLSNLNPQTTTLRLLFNRGAGTEQRDYTAQAFETTALRNSH